MKNFLKNNLLIISIVIGVLALHFLLGQRLLNYVFSLPAFLLGIPVVTTFILSKVKITGNGVQLVTWIIGVGLAYLSMILNVGMFGGMDLMETLINGFVTTLAANGIADVGFIQWILDKLGVKRKE